MLKKILMGIGIVLAVGAAGLGTFVFWQVRAYDSSTTKKYDVPLPTVTLSTDASVIDRGRHLAESMGECVGCHGPTMAGGKVEAMGPLGRMVIPNVTSGKGGRAGKYSDGELARLIKHGVKRDGTTVRMMPSQNMSWWPEEDVAAVISWLRSLPPAEGDPGVVEFGAMAKVLDRVDSIPIDQARRIDHQHLPEAPPPSPDAKYGSFVGTACRGCHGSNLSGGPIPGAPPDLPVPLNLTPHETGLKGWTLADFKQLLNTGKRKDGRPLAEFMPVEMVRNLNDLEMQALWAYLQSVPPRPFGDR